MAELNLLKSEPVIFINGYDVNEAVIRLVKNNDLDADKAKFDREDIAEISLVMKEKLERELKGDFWDTYDKCLAEAVKEVLEAKG